MAYTKFDDTKPVDSVSGSSWRSTVKDNFQALQHAIMFGTMEGWNLTVSTSGTGGSHDRPTHYKWEEGTEDLQLNFYWTANGAVTRDTLDYMVLWYSPNGTGWNEVGLVHFAYNSDYICTSATWEQGDGSAWGGTGASYTKFDYTIPSMQADGTELTDDVRNNMKALEDAALWQWMPDWSFRVIVGTGTEEQPQTFEWYRGQEKIQAVITWGSSGGALYQITGLVLWYQARADMAWSKIDTLTVTWDSEGNPQSSSWLDSTPTNVYAKHDSDIPNNSDHHVVIRECRYNLWALRDWVVCMIFPEWRLDKVTGVGNAQFPHEYKYEYKAGGAGNEEVEWEISWNSTYDIPSGFCLWYYTGSVWEFINEINTDINASTGAYASITWTDAGSCTI